MEIHRELYPLAEKIADLPSFISVQKSFFGWEITFTTDSLTEEDNNIKSKSRKFVSLFDRQFNPVSTFEIPKEVKFRHVHPGKNLTIFGTITKDNDSSVAEITILLGGKIIKKKLENVCDFYTDSYFVSPNPWGSDKYFILMVEKKPEGKGFQFNETFGEKYDGKRNPTMMLLDLNSLEVEDIPLLELAGYYPMSPQFVDKDSIVFQGYSNSSHKLGIRYCLNRPTAIIVYNLVTKKIHFISGKEFSARSPRLVGSSIYYLRGPLYYSHFSACDLVQYDLKSETDTVIIPNECMDHFEELLPIQSNCQALVMNPIVGTTKQIISPNSKSGPCELNGIVLAAIDDYIFLDTGIIDGSQNNYRISVLKNDEICACLFKYEKIPEITGLEKTFFKINSNAEYVLYKLKGSTNSEVILWPHGGPNSSCIDFNNEVIPLLLHAGFDIARINYTGSVGYSKKAIDELIIGQQDITDTLNAAEELQKSYQKLIMMGGSHGGFISATMVGKYPEMFSAAVLMNPVIDLYSMITTSDIYDWSFGQLQYPFSVEKIYVDSEFMKMLQDASPGRYAHNIKCPILLLLGEKDRRVPMGSQGLFLRKLANRLIDTLVYPDSDHSLDAEMSKWDIPFQIIKFLQK
jgi:acylaminoacyl-peptidase